MQFTELGLIEPLVRAVSDLGYDAPTPIQQQAIPAVLSGSDLLAAAQTGTGKTAGFVLPILHRLAQSRELAVEPTPIAPAGTQPPSRGGERRGEPIRRAAGRHPIRALILTPTRELAAQVEESVRAYGRHLPLKSMAMFGGVNINPQIDRLRGRVDVLVATPGRLLDHVSQRTIDLSRIEILVLDEADRMLDMGFLPDIRRVLSLLPRTRQNLLFSATFSDEIRTLASGLLVKPRSIEVARRNAPAEAVDQSVILVDRDAKRDLLAHLIRERAWYQVLVFTRTKHGANRLAESLDKGGIPALAIHGNKSQGARTRALAEFKDGTLQVLVATDIAARGIDIDELPHVVNYELPNVPEDYVHRIGRTGRAGSSGQAVSLVCVDEHAFLRGIEKLIGRALPRESIAGFEPDLSVRPQPILMGNGRRDDGPRRNQRPAQGSGRPPGKLSGPGRPQANKPAAPPRQQAAKPAATHAAHAPAARPGSAPSGRGFGHTQSAGRRPGARGR